MAARSSSAATSRDHDAPLSPVDSQNVFSDEYAESLNESYAPSIAAPSIRHNRSASPSPDRSSLQRAPSQSSINEITSPFADPPRRSWNSIRKSEGNGDDATTGTSRRGVGPALATGFSSPTQAGPSSSMAHRSVSSASSFAGSQVASNHGADGPSHPYAMYPQNLAMSRTASIASTARPLSHAPSIRGPAHPYGMYTQNVHEDGPSSGPQNSIPVGFLGSHQNYQRRVGPDGEEQDIIGPDGHTEQLPPYSRYPDEVNHKTMAQAGTLPSIGEQRAEETSPISPVAAAHLAQPPPPSQPTSAEPDVDHQHLNEKTWERKTTNEKWRTKVFGMPLWIMLLIFILTVVLAVIAGAVVGALVSQRGNAHKGRGKHPLPDPFYPDQTSSPVTNAATTTTTAFVDVNSPTATPGWMQPPPAGTYVIESGAPAYNVSGCLQPAQQPAWSCLLEDSPQLTISEINGSTIMSLIDTNPEVQYGTQPPVVTSDQVQLVQDPETDNEAYAWHFQTTYDKLVVLDVDNGLLPLNSKSKRSSKIPWYATGFQQKSEKDDDNDSGDIDNVNDSQAWFCYWNSTFIEVLVYMGNQSISSTTAQPSSSGSTATSASSFSSIGIGLGPQIVSTSTSTSFANTRHRRRGGNEQTGSPVVDQSKIPTSPVPSPTRKIKIEERRLPSLNAPGPTCTLMANGQDGQWRPAIRDNGLIPVVALREQDPVESPMATGELKRKRAIPTDACGCQWNSPNGQHP